VSTPISPSALDFLTEAEYLRDYPAEQLASSEHAAEMESIRAW